MKSKLHMLNLPQNNSIQNSGHKRPDHSKGWESGKWLIPFDGEYALIFKESHGLDEDELYGPILFCCQNALAAYQSQATIDLFKEANWQMIGSRQVSDWLDAGIQMIKLVTCSPNHPTKISIQNLTGKAARKALRAIT